ncbi:hypothetical protein FV226_11305 [Methylobacterium sp. WL12]|uniref:hypothetical protein n=1 Tax=Methylobacterium sp. WL12 TaxID=2603890 RepID=UPI0011CADF89|nr:hypothetical protein [Methylobacterium sp. WL12]TXM72760.1 hypothetical protein FV226_11305 [Methylobacterium sp. WL12]
MQGYATSFGLGFVAGMRNMTACAALAWAASEGRTRGNLIPAGPGVRMLATGAAIAEMAGDKMPFAPDRRVPPSFAFRIAVGAFGGWALAVHRSSPEIGALAGVGGAVAGTLLGRAARGPNSRTGRGRTKGLVEDAIAVGLAVLVISSSERQPQTSDSTFRSLST